MAPIQCPLLKCGCKIYKSDIVEHLKTSHSLQTSEIGYKNIYINLRLRILDEQLPLGWQPKLLIYKNCKVIVHNYCSVNTLKLDLMVLENPDKYDFNVSCGNVTQTFSSKLKNTTCFQSYSVLNVEKSFFDRDAEHITFKLLFSMLESI
tara:strand:- start:1551 stop:1997 length:447 start_codon:yes stop_codon:yes gene_type:complete